MFSVLEKDCWNNTWFADPMVLGRYPEDGLRLLEGELPDIRNGDMETISQPLDFYGANIYHGQAGRAASGGGFDPVQGPDGPALTTMDWRVTPAALYWGPRFLYERYGLPVVITENGMANCDWVHRDAKVHDPQRIDFLTRYLLELKRAIDDGVPVKGYFLWSVMDNFEWAQGYKQRFGLIHVDYPSGKRTLKDSAYWYNDVIASNGDILSDR
jgi:beta-glucosidase